MRSHKTYSKTMRWRCHLILAALAVVAVMGCMFNPTAAEDPPEMTEIQDVRLLFNYDLIALWHPLDFLRSADVGVKINRIDADITINEEYASNPDAAIANTRIHVVITGLEDGSEDFITVFDGFLNDIEALPGKIENAWVLTRSQQFDDHTLFYGKYIIYLDYDILIGDTWTYVDSANPFLDTTRPAPPADIPTGYDVWLPVMLSFAVIAGMAFIGYNLTRDSNPSPAPALFMLFVGVVVTWSFGWLPPWVFITAIALLSLASAMLWGKLFKGR